MIDMMFNGGSSTPVTATLRNFSGAFGSVLMAEQVGFNGDGSVDLANLPDLGAYLQYEVSLGGAFGFDIFFSDDLATDGAEGGSWFSVGLYDALGVLGDEFGIVSFELKPGEGIAAPYADEGFARRQPAPPQAAVRRSESAKGPTRLRAAGVSFIWWRVNGKGA